MKIMLDEGAFSPVRKHSDDAGLDIRTPKGFTIPKGGSAVVDCGVHFDIPVGCYGELRGRSGLHINHDIVCFGGTIDCGYQDSVKIKLYNLGKEDFVFQQGDRIAQLVIMPCKFPDVEVVDSFDEETERGNAGIGSTGL